MVHFVVCEIVNCWHNLFISVYLIKKSIFSEPSDLKETFTTRINMYRTKMLANSNKTNVSNVEWNIKQVSIFLLVVDVHNFSQVIVLLYKH